MNTNSIPVQTKSRFPTWLRRKILHSQNYKATCSILSSMGINTVCRSAKCPNLQECWGKGTATFMICGDTCTRTCKFCAVSHGVPKPIDPHEPEKVASAARKLKLTHVVITSVTRDDLPDGGATHFKNVLDAVKNALPNATTEVLVPDFNGNIDSIKIVIEAKPDVFNHNLETVQRLTPVVRSRASYQRSLNVLKTAHMLSKNLIKIKSGLMVGLGETEPEVIATLKDLRNTGCTIVTIGQYLQPGHDQLPVVEFIPPEQFSRYATIAYELGFEFVASAPFVRSSYNANELVKKFSPGEK